MRLALGQIREASDADPALSAGRSSFGVTTKSAAGIANAPAYAMVPSTASVRSASRRGAATGVVPGVLFASSPSPFPSALPSRRLSSASAPEAAWMIAERCEVALRMCARLLASAASWRPHDRVLAAGFRGIALGLFALSLGCASAPQEKKIVCDPHDLSGCIIQDVEIIGNHSIVGADIEERLATRRDLASPRLSRARPAPQRAQRT